MLTEVARIEPGTFEPENHFYPRVLNAHIHPMVRDLMEMGNERIASRFCHLHPEIEADAVNELLRSVPKYFHWGGCDLFHVTSEEGQRSVVVIETNSCPSGQKSMPRVNESFEMAGYRRLMSDSFLKHVGKRKGVLPKGDIAVLYDKNHMENSGYAAALAELANHHIWLVPFHKSDVGRTAEFDEQGVLHVLYQGQRIPIRAAFRYVTQQPWNRIPPLTKTMLFNPVLVCLAGGRNKLVASKAYDIYNSTQLSTGLKINTPETIWDVSKEEVPMWVARMGGIAVVKVPYSNAGQGVYTITSQRELDNFMEHEHDYDHYIVQSLIGNAQWSSRSERGRLFHVGTMPNKKLHLYAADVRFMVGTGPDGFFPAAIYARRARKALTAEIQAGDDSWDMLGTNLSVKHDDGSFTTQPERLLLVDSRDFNRLGVGLDDLIEGYLQSVMSIVAIDNMAKGLINTKGKFRKKLFGSVNPDQRFNKEVLL